MSTLKESHTLPLACLFTIVHFDREAATIWPAFYDSSTLVLSLEVSHDIRLQSELDLLFPPD